MPRGTKAMQSPSFADVAATTAAVVAAAGLLYARASVRAAREAAAAARRSVEIAERSREAAARARLRLRVEHMGELVQEIMWTSHTAPGTDGLSLRSQAQCRVLDQAVIGLKDLLPKSAQVGQARSSAELADRAAVASMEIDGVLKKLTRHRPKRAYRPRRQAPWHRPARARSGATAGGVDNVRRRPSS